LSGLASFQNAFNEILESVKQSVSNVPNDQIGKMIEMMLEAQNHRLMVIGVGRSGLIGRSFAMRLMHLGFNVHVMGETITPAIGKDDLIIAISGSGATKLAITAAEIAKEVGAKIIAITSYQKSDLAKIADHVVEIRGRTKAVRETDYFLRQIMGEHEPLAPLGTIFEISSMIFLDSVIVEIMQRLGKTEREMKQRHATIE